VGRVFSPQLLYQLRRQPSCNRVGHPKLTGDGKPVNLVVN
jgi:hypothetical protein